MVSGLLQQPTGFKAVAKFVIGEVVGRIPLQSCLEVGFGILALETACSIPAQIVVGSKIARVQRRGFLHFSNEQLALVEKIVTDRQKLGDCVSLRVHAFRSSKSLDSQI